MLTVDDVKAAVAALKDNDGEAALAILEQMIASAATGGEGEEAPSAGEELADDEAPAEEEMSQLADDEEEAPEKSGLGKVLMEITGKASVGEAVNSLKAAHKNQAALAKQQAALDLSSRRDLIAQMIELGVETPATAWAGDASKRVPCDRLARESVDSMRSRVEVLSKARGRAIQAPRSTVTPATLSGKAPETVAEQVARLSAKTLGEIKKLGLTPEQFVERRASAVRRIVG